VVREGMPVVKKERVKERLPRAGGQVGMASTMHFAQ